MENNKYIITRIDQVILFDESIAHLSFRNLSPIRAGFFYIEDDLNVKCYGKSVSLSDHFAPYIKVHTEALTR